MARGIDFEPANIKAWIFDELADMNETLGIDGTPLSDIYERISALRPVFSYRDVEDKMYEEGIGIVDALEELEDELASM